MTNNSGKFTMPPYSNIAAETEVPNTSDTPLSKGVNEPPVDFPSMPEDTMGKMRRLLGEWWWLWIVAIVFYLSNRK